MARWARSRGGGGEGRGRAPQPFRGSSPSPALARPLARARALPSGSSSLPGPAGRCAFAPFPRYLGRRTPPPPRRSSSVCHRSCPNALTSPRCRRPRPARKREGSGGAGAHARAGPSLGRAPFCRVGWVLLYQGRWPWLAPRAQVFSLFCPLYPWEEPPCPTAGAHHKLGLCFGPHSSAQADRGSLVASSRARLLLLFCLYSLWGLFPHPSPHPPRKRRG